MRALSGCPGGGFTTRWYGDVVGRPGFGDALGTSLKLALISTFAALAIGTPVAFVLARARGLGRGVLSAMTNLPFVVPGVLIGLGLLTLADLLNFQLGIGITAAAHTLLLLPIVVTVVATRLALLNPELVQASRDLGSSPSRAFRTVTLPLIAPSLVGAALIGAAFSLDEIFVTTFTIGTNSTLPIWILSQARVGFDPGLNALGVMLVALTLVVPGAAYGAYRLLRAGLRSSTFNAPVQGRQS